MDKASSQNCINPYVLLCKTHTPQHTCLEIKISSSNLLQSEKESHLVRGRVKSVSGFQKLLASPTQFGDGDTKGWYTKEKPRVDWQE